MLPWRKWETKNRSKQLLDPKWDAIVNPVNVAIYNIFQFQWKPQAIVFGIVTNKKFDMIIMGFIGINMLTMTLDHYQQNSMWSFALDNLNLAFIVIFTTECILKIFALRQYYFKEPWNVFDFIVVILSILGKSFELSWTWTEPELIWIHL